MPSCSCHMRFRASINLVEDYDDDVVLTIEGASESLVTRCWKDALVGDGNLSGVTVEAVRDGLNGLGFCHILGTVDIGFADSDSVLSGFGDELSADEFRMEQFLCPCSAVHQNAARRLAEKTG